MHCCIVGEQSRHPTGLNKKSSPDTGSELLLSGRDLADASRLPGQVHVAVEAGEAGVEPWATVAVIRKAEVAVF